MQKVFVAGATGVLGRRVVAKFVAAEFEVTGVARSSSKQDDLAALGARPIALELFDRAAVHAAVSGHEVVCNLATAIPVGERASVPSAWEENDRIRRDGTSNLVDAALAAGASCYLQESVAFVYADGGERVLDESAAIGATGVAGASLVAEARRPGSQRTAGPGSRCVSDSSTASIAATPFRRSKPPWLAGRWSSDLSRPTARQSRLMTRRRL